MKRVKQINTHLHKLQLYLTYIRKNKRVIVQFNGVFINILCLNYHKCNINVNDKKLVVKSTRINKLASHFVCKNIPVRQTSPPTATTVVAATNHSNDHMLSGRY